MFLALAITCDEYFVTSLEKICEVRGSVLFRAATRQRRLSETTDLRFCFRRNWIWARTLQEPPSWQLAAPHQSFSHPSLVHTHTHTNTRTLTHVYTQMFPDGQCQRWLWVAPLCMQVSSSPTAMWGWGPSSAQQSSTSSASSVCVGSSLDRCVGVCVWRNDLVLQQHHFVYF